MSIVHPIDAICRELSKGQEPDKMEVLIKVDDRGTVLSGLAARLKVKRRYAVRSNHQVEMGVATLRVRDFENNASLDVSVRWRARLRSEDGSELILASVKADRSILKTVELEMQECLQMMSDQRGGSVDLGNWLYNDKKMLSASIATALKPLGLEVDAIVESDAFAPRSLALKTPNFEVKTQNATRKVGLSLEIRLDPKTNVKQAGPKTAGDWDLQLREWTKTYVERHETLDHYYRDEQFGSRLRKHIGEKLDSLGWSVGRFFFSRDKLPDTTESFSDHLQIEWTSVKGRKFVFNVRVGIDIVDISRYDLKARPNLRSFAQQSLTKNLHDVLFAEDTDNLSPERFEGVKAEVHRRICNDAGENGLKITTLVPDPVIEEWNYLKNQRYVIPARDYPTLDPNICANFDINVYGRIDTISAAFAALGQTQPVEKQLQTIVERSVEGFMREVEFNDYINAFAPKTSLDSDDESSDSMVYIHNQLASCIEKALRIEFHFIAEYVNIQRHDPDVNDIQDKINNFEPQVFSLKIKSAEYRIERDLIPFTIRLRFVAPSIEYVAKLFQRKLNLQDMVSLVEQRLKILLDGRKAETLYGTSYVDKVTLGAELQRELNATLSNSGLAVEVESVDSEMSETMQIAGEGIYGLELDKQEAFIDDRRAEIKQSKAMRDKANYGDQIYLEKIDEKRVQDLDNNRYVDVDEKREDLLKPHRGDVKRPKSLGGEEKAAIDHDGEPETSGNRGNRNF